MALELDSRYPGRFNPGDADYPQGSFKNRTAPGSLDGSYLEKDWANDKEGFFQRLLLVAGISPNGNVDTALASQYYSALVQIIQANSADTVNAPVATVAAAGTINLTTGAPNTSQLVISGTGVSINGFTVAANRFFVVKMTGASNTLVNSASLVTGRGANITAYVGDTFVMRSTAANTVEILGYVAAIPPATRLTRIASATLQTVSGATVTPAVYTPLSYSFTADGGMYDIFVKINLNLITTGAGGSNYVAVKLLNGVTVLDTSANNIQVEQQYGVQLTLKWSGVLTGAVNLTVTFEKTYAVGSLTVNGDRDNTTNNDSGQLSCIEVYRMGA